MSRLTQLKPGRGRTITTTLLAATEPPMCVHSQDGLALVIADPAGSGLRFMLHLSPSEARLVSAALPRLLAQKVPRPGTRAAICNSVDPDHLCPACDA